MNKVLLSVMAFIVGVGMSISFQNCGGSSLQANSSDNDGLQVDVVNDEEDDGTITGENGEFGFNLGRGDNIFYTTGGGLSLDFATTRFLSTAYYVFLETHVYEQRGTTFTRDLPTAYCTNSALPHCAHTTTAPCVGLGCYKSTTPVRCHWQKRASTAEMNRAIGALSNIQFVTRNVTAEDPMISDCNDPLLYFYKEGSSLDLSLAQKGCVPDGMYYAVDNSGDDIQTIFDAEINDVDALTNNQGDPEYCNLYANYYWGTSKVTYSSRSGSAQAPEDSYAYDVTYEAKTISINGEDRLAGMADLVFREPESGAGDGNTYCANGVPVQPAEIDVLFPEEGLNYEVLRTQSAVSTVPTSEVTYEDPVDGGSVWRLFLTRGTALTHSGGPIVDAAQAQAIQNIMETVLVNRAKTSGLAQPCPPASQ